MKNVAVFGALALCALSGTAFGQVPPSAFVNFEASQTNPVRLSPDGKTLYAVDTPDARLSVFDVSTPATPVLKVEIPVGIEPVSVNPRTKDEVWVVNQVSDSVSVVSVSKKIITDTIYAKDEPSDVVFAGGYAFVSISRSNMINVYDETTHALVNSIPVFGGNPRAMAVSPNGATVYAAFAESGNATTIIPFNLAGPPPKPVNPKLKPAPAQSIIVKANDPNWTSFIQFTMPDNDVVAIDVASQTVTQYYSGVGTLNLGLAVNPKTGDLYVANTDSLNTVRFDCALPGCPPGTNVRGHFINNRITQILVGSGTITPFDLNPNIDYTVLPNPAALATALSQPAGTVFDPSGNFMWVAAFGTDRVAKVSTSGQVLSFVEVGEPGTTVDPKSKRGPRGLALNSKQNTLYVMNRITNTISVIDTSTGTLGAEVPVGSFNPTPTVILNGRGFLYDAKLSGNGTGACAACHLDGDIDHLAWDLGDPTGSMQTVKNGGDTFHFHPMKGPMTTQTLKGLKDSTPFHWRGDHKNFAAFNPAFNDLLGNVPLTNANMTAYQNFVFTMNFQPNPNQNMDRSLPSSIPTAPGGNPQTGETIYHTQPFTGNITCNFCHTAGPGIGSNRIIIPAVLLQEPQAFKVPELRNIYQKLLFNNAAGAASIDGFGLLNDGSDATVFQFLEHPVFASFSKNVEIQTQLNAFLQCFDTGMAPAVGYSFTANSTNVNSSTVIANWSLLESQAGLTYIDLISTGTIDGKVHSLLYSPTTGLYTPDTKKIAPLTHAQLVALIVAGDTQTPMGVPPGTGTRMGIDRDLNGVLNADQ